MRGMKRFSGRAAMAALAVMMLAPVAPLRAGPPPALSVYGKLPGVESVAISPSGNRIAMVGIVEEKRQLIVLEQGKKSLIAFPLDDSKIRGVYWAGEDRVMIRTSTTAKLDGGFITEKTELQSMVVIPLNGEKAWSVFANDDKVRGGIQGFYGIQEREGRYYGYFGGLTYGGDFRSPEAYLVEGGPMLYEVDLQSGQAKSIASRFQGRGFRDWAVGQGGTLTATLDYTSTSGNWLIRNNAGQKIAEGTNKLGRVELMGLGATPETVILSEQIGDEPRRWFEIPLTGGERKPILTDVYLDNAYFDVKTRRLTGYRTESDMPDYVFFDAFRQKVIKATMKAFPDMLVQYRDANDKFDKLIVMTEGVGDPQTWWSVDIRTGQASELGYSYPVGSADVGPMQMVKYKAGDGMDISAVLTLPPGRTPKKLPVVILPHGGPAARDYPGFDWWAQAFASRGYAVLQPNFRGSTGYGIDFEQAGRGEWGRKMQSDISDGLAFLAAQGIADPKRACIMGASYGGYAALAGVTLQKGLYRCAVAVAGISDVTKHAAIVTQDSGYDPTMKRALELEIGARKDLRSISPVNFAAQADAPILLIHGKDDLVVRYDQSNDMAVALKAAGKPVEMVTLAGEDHWLSRGETRLAMLEAAVRFVEANNPADPAP